MADSSTVPLGLEALKSKKGRERAQVQQGQGVRGAGGWIRLGQSPTGGKPATVRQMPGNCWQVVRQVSGNCWQAPAPVALGSPGWRGAAPETKEWQGYALPRLPGVTMRLEAVSVCVSALDTQRKQGAAWIWQAAGRRQAAPGRVG